MSRPPRPPWHTPAHCPLPCPSTMRLSEESAAGRCRKVPEGRERKRHPEPPAPPHPRSGPPCVHPETLRISASLGLIFSNQRTGLGGNALSGAGRGGLRAPGCSWGSVGRGGGPPCSGGQTASGKHRALLRGLRVCVPRTPAGVGARNTTTVTACEPAARAPSPRAQWGSHSLLGAPCTAHV